MLAAASHLYSIPSQVPAVVGTDFTDSLHGHAQKVEGLCSELTWKQKNNNY